jgi:segregation and condensation protein B
MTNDEVVTSEAQDMSVENNVEVAVIDTAGTESDRGVEASSADAPSPETGSEESASGADLARSADSSSTAEANISEAPKTAEAGAAAVDPAEPVETKPQLSEAQKVALLEALLLASGEPLSISRIQDVMGGAKGEILQLADQLQAQLANESRGIELVVVAEKLQLRTKAAYADYVRQLMAVRPRKLSNAALETLAVVAYQQPVVKSELDKIRGVDVAPTLKTLLERKLVKILGYQASVGQPALYGTTEEFLQIFGLPALSSLPSIQDLKALIKEPGEAQAAPTEDDADESPVEEPYHEQSLATNAAEAN